MFPLTLTCPVVLNANLCGMASAVGWEETGSPILEVGVATEIEFEVKRGYNTQQLLNEAEQDTKNSADQGGCYPQRPKAEVDNTLRDLQNSSYPKKAEFNNCFIIHSKYFLLLKVPMK